MSLFRCAATIFAAGFASLSTVYGGGDDPLAASVDLGGIVVKHGADIKRSSLETDTISASTAYDFAIYGTVTGSGAFGFIEPGTSIAEALEMVDEGFSKNLDGTVINPSGKQKFTVLNRKLKGEMDFAGAPVKAKAKIVAGIHENGRAFFWFTGVSFTVGPKSLKPGDTITFDPGSKCDIRVSNAAKPSPAARPDLLFSLPKQEALGNNIYAGHTINVTISAGHAVKSYLLLFNDSLTTDSFTLSGPGSGDGVQIRYFAGKTDVTDDVVDGTYVVSNVAPRTGVVLKLKLKVKNGANHPGDFILRSSVNPAVTDSIHFVVKAS